MFSSIFVNLLFSDKLYQFKILLQIFYAVLDIKKFKQPKILKKFENKSHTLEKEDLIEILG